MVLLEVPDRPTMTEDLRRQDAVAHALPDAVRRAVDAYDPAGEAVWLVGPFIGTAPIDGREVLGGRPARVDRAGGQAGRRRDLGRGRRARGRRPRIVALDRRTPPCARRRRDLDEGQGVVWSGDARDGFNGGGDFVRWVLTDDDAARRRSPSSGSRCDRVRVMPFLEGVPCSIHGIVLPDGTARLRPVELAILRGAGRRFVYGGLGTTWDPPDEDRARMRELARRTGDHLRADGRLPGRLRHRRRAHRRRVPAHRAQRPAVRRARRRWPAPSTRRLFTLLQLNLVSGRDPRRRSRGRPRGLGCSPCGRRSGSARRSR